MEKSCSKGGFMIPYDLSYVFLGYPKNEEIFKSHSTSASRMHSREHPPLQKRPPNFFAFSESPYGVRIIAKILKLDVAPVLRYMTAKLDPCAKILIFQFLFLIRYNYRQERSAFIKLSGIM